MIFMLAPTFTFANSNLRECDAASCFLRRVGAEREREKVHQVRDAAERPPPPVGSVSEAQKGALEGRGTRNDNSMPEVHRALTL